MPKNNKENTKEKQIEKYHNEEQYEHNENDEDEPENMEAIESRIAKQIEEFHKFKNEALEECSEFLNEVESK